MSILASLAHAYERLKDAPPFGFSTEKITYLISLNDDGSPAGAPIDLRDTVGKKRLPRLMAVPTSFKRPGVTPRAFFLWDNSAFVLGISANETKDCEPRWQAFRALHQNALRESNDAGLTALRRFLDFWLPDKFVSLGWPEEMNDQNIVFALESERRERLLHERPAARSLWARLAAEGGKSSAICLVTGENAPIARLHPAVKGVWGAQTSGASIVSFNLDAFTSYGHEQGDNAPVSEAAAFAYTTALNKFLETGSRQRIQIGDASTVFWADASDAPLAEHAEDMFAAMFTDIDEAGQAGRVRVLMEKIRCGLPLRDFAPELETGVRFFVLGLAPNAARLSIRYWFEDDFGTIARHYQHFVEDMRLDPPPRDPFPVLWRYLAETAVLGKRENVPPNLAGEWMRAILSGGRYPQTLLAAVLMRLRADRNVTALRVGILKALLIRNFHREVPVGLDLENADKGYLLGRLFAVYEYVQSAALGSRVNATIKDKFYGAAAAQPRRLFSLLDRGSANHLSKVGKQSAGRKVNLERRIGEIMELMDPTADPFPASLSAAEQALFGLGYYHQRHDLFTPKKPDTN